MIPGVYADQRVLAVAGLISDDRIRGVHVLDCTAHIWMCVIQLELIARRTFSSVEVGNIRGPSNANCTIVNPTLAKHEINALEEVAVIGFKVTEPFDERMFLGQRAIVAIGILFAIVGAIVERILQNMCELMHDQRVNPKLPIRCVEAADL